MRYILAGDLGGTNPRLAMVDEHGQVVFKQQLPNDAASLVPLINDFLRLAAEHGYTTDTCCLGVAGPVQNNSCTLLANARYAVEDAAIRHGTLLRNILVINDFAALGAAIASLPTDSPSLVRLPGNGHPDPAGNRAVIGAGTGLGLAYLIRQQHGFLVSASEGGHASAPALQECADFTEWLRRELGVEFLDSEELISGKGIRHAARYYLLHPHALRQLVEHAHVYHHEKALLDKHSNYVQEEEQQLLRDLGAEAAGDQSVDGAQKIAALADRSAACRIALRLFARHLGIAAQDAALHGLARGGVFVAGGIAAKQQDLLLRGDFAHSFYTHSVPAMRALLAQIPVYLVADYDTSFTGCFVAARAAFP